MDGDHPMTPEQTQVLESVKAAASIEEAAQNAGRPVASGVGSRRAANARTASTASSRARGRCARRAQERRASAGWSAEPAGGRAPARQGGAQGSVPALRLWFEQRGADESSRRGEEARRLI